MKYFVASAFLISATSCYHRSLLFEAESLSVTRTDSGSSPLVVGDEVENKWCRGQEPVYKKDEKYQIGLAEQAIFLAQGNGKKADFILDARVYTDTDGCAIVTGKRATIKKN